MPSQIPLENQDHLTNIPLAEKVRPATITEIIGQEKLLTSGSSLRTMIENDDFSSFILWGPPGCGKTTIIRLIENQTNHHFSSFSAVLAKIATVKELMQQASRNLAVNGEKTIVFVDEIHRFNKSQQDAFLPYVESGAILLMGATTENPSFEVIPALLSRCHIFKLESLSKEQIISVLQKGITKTSHEAPVEPSVFEYIAEFAGGDARKALNSLEIILRKTLRHIPITLEKAKEALGSRSLFYDKNGEEHYNLISALHKSVRGSDPQAALYWLARMVEAGEDPMYLVRRLMRMASEDIGLADPQALVQAVAVKEAVHFLGMPEANTALTQLVVYLATAPKSNSCEVAYFAARDDAIKSGTYRVPLHICNSPTKMMKDFGYGEGYKYAHDFENHYAYQKYFPDEMEEKTYYTPSNFGFERDIGKRLDWWKKLKEQELKKKKG